MGIPSQIKAWEGTVDDVTGWDSGQIQVCECIYCLGFGLFRWSHIYRFDLSVSSFKNGQQTTRERRMIQIHGGILLF